MSVSVAALPKIGRLEAGIAERKVNDDRQFALQNWMKKRPFSDENGRFALTVIR